MAMAESEGEIYSMREYGAQMNDTHAEARRRARLIGDVRSDDDTYRAA